MSKEMEKAIEALHTAVGKELNRKAKFGFKAVIADSQGKPKLVSAKYLLRKMKTVSC